MPVYHAHNAGSYTAAAADREYDLVFAGYKPTSKLWCHTIELAHNYTFCLCVSIGNPPEVSKTVMGDTWSGFYMPCAIVDARPTVLD